MIPAESRRLETVRERDDEESGIPWPSSLSPSPSVVLCLCRPPGLALSCAQARWVGTGGRVACRVMPILRAGEV
jgi:hypothetical protein